MKRFLGAVFVAMIFSGLGGSTRADDPDPKVILDKAINALGGEEKLAKAVSATWKAKGKLTINDADSEFTGRIIAKDADHFRLELEGEFNGNKFNAVTVVNGDKGWRKVGDNSMDIDKDGLAVEKRNFYVMATPTTLVQLKGKDFKIQSGGEEKVGDKPAIALKVTGPDGKDFTLYFDKESGLPIRQVAKVTGFMGDEFTQERLYSDYKDFDGVKKATKVVAKRDGEKFVDEEITEFKIMEKIEADTFSEPK
jgi:hypothetical protein